MRLHGQEGRGPRGARLAHGGRDEGGVCVYGRRRGGVHPSLADEGKAKVLGEVLVGYQVVVAVVEADNAAAPRLSSRLRSTQQHATPRRQVAIRLEGVGGSQSARAWALPGPQLGDLVVLAEVSRALADGGRGAGGGGGGAATGL